MKVWLVRAGRKGQDEERALEEGYAIIGFSDIPDLRSRPKIKSIFSAV